MINRDELVNRFRYHAPVTDKRRADHQTVRDQFGYVAAIMNELLPDGREKDICMAKIEEAMFWANAGLARSEP